MKKLIELGASIDAAICAADEYDGGYNFERDRKIRDALMALPTVDAVPARHGKWMLGVSLWYCSECGSSYSYGDYAFCPNCGADMRGESDG